MLLGFKQRPTNLLNCRGKGRLKVRQWDCFFVVFATFAAGISLWTMLSHSQHEKSASFLYLLANPCQKHVSKIFYTRKMMPSSDKPNAKPTPSHNSTLCCCQRKTQMQKEKKSDRIRSFSLSRKMNFQFFLLFCPRSRR